MTFIKLLKLRLKLVTRYLKLATLRISTLSPLFAVCFKKTSHRTLKGFKRRWHLIKLEENIMKVLILEAR